jgi:hypothetical protein
MRRSYLLPLVLLLGSLVVEVAHAQPAEREQALEMARDALGLFAQQRWVEARDRFAQAEALVHSPVFVLYMARSERQLQRLLAARAYYEQLQRERLPADAPEPWRSAQGEGASELAALLPTIPSLRLLIDPGSRSVPEVTLDGQRLDPPPIDAAVAVDPGEHEVILRLGPGAEARRRVSAPAQGGEVLADFRTPATESGGAVVGGLGMRAPAAPAETPVMRPDPGPGRVVAFGVTALALGGVCLTVFAITGSAAIDADSELEARCPDDTCSPTYEDRVDEYYALANAATGTLIAGSALVLTGGILLSVAAQGSQPIGSTVAWSLRVAPGSFGLVGRF